jgi:hypothetical protein
MQKEMAVNMRTLLKKVPGIVSRTMVYNMDNLDDLCVCACQFYHFAMSLLER